MKRAWLISFLLFSIFAGALLPIMAHASTLDSSEELATLLPPSDSICEGNAYITTQAEWDQFAADYAGCTTFIGDITIDNSSAAIDSVSGLDSLQVMAGDLVVEYTGVPIVFNTLNSLDTLAGDLTISNCPEYFIKLSELDYTENIFLQNTQLDGTNGLVNLRECQSLIMIADNLNQSTIFNELNRCPVIEIRTESISGQGGNLRNSFVQLISVDTVIVDYFNMSIEQSFLAVQNIDLLQLGSLSGYIAAAHESFDGLTNANTVFLHTNYTNINLPNLVSVENIHIEEYPPSIVINEPILESLETISETAYLWICRDIIELSELRVAGELNIFSQSTFIENIGPSAINLPKLEFVQGNLEIRASPFGEFIDTSLHALYAPLLTNVGGSISILNAPALTSCISPAFCESANYSPNWGDVSGGPGCSSIEAIQAQCDAICADLDLNGICDSVQTVYVGDLVFTTQIEIDSFFVAFPLVHLIDGDVTFLFPNPQDGSANTIADTISTLPFLQIDTIAGALTLHGGGTLSFSLSLLSGLHQPSNEALLLDLFGFQNLISLDSLDLYGRFGVITENQDIQGELFPSLQDCNSINLFSGQSMHISGFNSLLQCGNVAINCPRFEEPEMQGVYNYALPAYGYITASWTISNAFQNLQTCSNLGFSWANVDSSCWSNLVSTGKLYMALSQVSSGFHNLLNLTSLLMELEISIPENSFSSLQSAEFIDLGNGAFIPYLSFPSLHNANAVSFAYDNLQATTTDSLTVISINLPSLLSTNFFLLHISTANPFLINLSSCESIENFSIYNYNQSSNDIFNLSLANEASIENLIMSDYSGQNLAFLDQDISIEHIEITGTSNLTNCTAQPICEAINYNPNNVNITGGPGCSSIEEIQAQCLGSYASGMVYYDIDCDNEFNNDDALVSYPIILQGDTLPVGSSGEAGYFSVPLQLNSTVSLYAQHSSDWINTGPLIITTDSTNQILENIQIGLCPVTIVHDVSINMNASMQPRPGFTVRYNIIAQNEWPGSDSVSVTFDTSLMPGATITGYAAGGTQQGATVSFATDLLYGQSQVLWVDVLVPVGTPLGTAYTATASITLVDSNDEDNHPENNTYSLQQTVIGSFDPNDKLVTPAIIDLLDVDSTATEWLEYTIRFQNTGTAEAIFVRVLDTLSQVFDMTSFELIATSHPCEVTFHDNHSIDWFFDNIMLPDSFSNEPESHGFIQFRIRTHALSEPSIIENAAGIYFDFNEPVITPPAITQVVICAEQGSACDDGDPLTQNDIISDDCTCSGLTEIPFSISLSANRICNGSDATFYVNGVPNAQVNYTLLNSYNSITLNDEGIGQINYSATGNDYTFNQDTLVLELLSYTSADNETIVLNQYSDTIYYTPYKEPILSTYSTNLDDCITLPEHAPYLLHEVQALQNSIVYFSYNSPVQYALSTNRSMFDLSLNQYPSNIENGFFNGLGWEYWPGISAFQNNLLQDSLGYLLLESNSLVGVPENYPLEVRIDSINYGGCIVNYDNLNSMVETPSAITGLHQTSVQCYDIPSNLIELPIFWEFPYSSSYLFLNYFSTFWFPKINSTNGLYEIPTIEFEYLFNGQPIHFDLNSSHLNDTVTIDNVIITASSSPSIDNYDFFDQLISISPLNGYFPVNDTISIQLVSYNGNDGCIINDSNAFVLYENEFNNPFMEHRFILNPTVFLPSDTAFLGCNGQTQWSVPTVEANEESGYCCSGNCLGSTANFLTNDISTPWQSLYTLICDYCSFTEDSVITISEPGTYYYILFDVDPGRVYVKPYIIESYIETICDDLDPCTLNDIIQPDCSCVGTYTDTDEDGVCDALENCIWSPILIAANFDTTLSCNEELPLFTAIFEMPDNSEFSVVYSDSLLQGEGCSFSVLQTAIAINSCGDSTSIARTVSFVDTEQPTFIDCLPTATVICNTYGNNLQAPAAIDNCSTDVIVTYTEECTDCAADSLIYPLSTPVLPIDNPCNYPYDWSMALMTAPYVHRYFKIESNTPAVMIDYLNGSIHFSGRFINVMDSTGGFDFNVTLGQGQNWETWSGDPNNNGYYADCGSIDDNHEEWMYYILQSKMGAELIGWGSYAGSDLNLFHTPVSGYFGLQMGLGANNYNEQFGVGGWSTYIGTLLYNAESVQPSGNSGSCNLCFAAPSCYEHTSEITWTATDCAGNSASCIQTVHFIPEIDEPECLVNTPCNDNDSCTINDTFQADCTCAGIYADADGDGVCDAEDNCDNTLAGTVCDDSDACTVNDVIQADCVCAGTYTDTDEDGVCDASEIAGCMDLDACNYAIDATDEDGSCTYVESLAIDGSAQATAGENVVYTYPGPALNTYAWSANPGTILTGQGTTQVSIVWDNALSGLISVIETNSENCVGDTVMLAVSIEPSAVTAWSQEYLVVYPNPASDQINLIGNIPTGTPLFLYNSIGACVMITPFASTIDVGHLPAGLYHLRIALANVHLEQSFVILR